MPAPHRCLPAIAISLLVCGSAAFTTRDYITFLYLHKMFSTVRKHPILLKIELQNFFKRTVTITECLASRKP